MEDGTKSEEDTNWTDAQHLIVMLLAAPLPIISHICISLVIFIGYGGVFISIFNSCLVLPALLTFITILLFICLK